MRARTGVMCPGVVLWCAGTWQAVDAELDPVDTSWCDLFEFAYEEKHFRRLLQLSEANVEQSKDSILSALACAVRRKQAQGVGHEK